VARTHFSINAFILAIIAALSISLVSACENTARGLKQDAAEAEADTRDERAEAASTARDAARDARAGAREAADTAAETARAVGAMAADAGEELAERAGAVKENVDVKAALMADPSVDASRIDVDVSAWSKTVTLEGYVPTAGERARAEEVAKAEAAGYKVVNSIVVQPRS
jgi:osmotically-inducible protein OsmY